MHNLLGGVSTTLLWGLGTSQARCKLLDAAPVALLSTGSGSPCVVFVPPQQYVGALGFPKSVPLRSVHGGVAPVSGTGTCGSSEKVLNAT